MPAARTRHDAGRVPPATRLCAFIAASGPTTFCSVSGGGQAGGHSAFFPSWSRGRSVPFVTKEIPS